MLLWFTNGALRTEHISLVTFTYQASRYAYDPPAVTNATLYLLGGQTFTLSAQEDCKALYTALEREKRLENVGKH